MTTANAHKSLQKIMDEAYTFYDDNMSYNDFLDCLEGKDKSFVYAVVAGAFNYQVENGGFMQWIENGYATSCFDVLVDLLTKMNTKNSNTILKFIKEFENDLNFDSDNKGYMGDYWKNERQRCEYCDGDGYTTIEDDDGETYDEDCCECGGLGYIEFEPCEAFDVSNMNKEFYKINDAWLEEVAAFIEAGNFDKPSATPKAESTGIRYPNVHVKLVGQDGNAFMILGAVSNAMRKNKIPKSEIDAFHKEAMNGDYDHMLRTVCRWVSAS